MKKFFVAALLTAFCVSVFAAADALPFISIRRTEFYPRTIDKCQSGEIAYTFEDNEGTEGTLVFRQKGAQLARIDLIIGDKTDSTGFDGKTFWNCDDTGCGTLSAEEANEFLYDVCFIAIPLREERMFRDLKKIGTETIDGDVCVVYMTAPVDNPEVQTKLFVSKASGLLRKVVTFEEGAESIVIFDDYRSIDGVRLAETIIKSNDVGVVKLHLRNARWNVDFAPDTFVMPKKMAHIALEEANIKRPKMTADSAKERELRRRIADLEGKIRINEEKIAKMEEAHSANRAAEVQLSTAPVTARYYGYWRRHGFRKEVRRSTRRTMRDRRRIVKQLLREDSKVADEYEKTTKELTKLRSDLSMAQEDLKRLEADK